MSENERLAVVEVDIKYLKKTVDRINTNVELLIKERHEGIGKKSMLLTIAAILGGLITNIIDYFRQ